MVGKINLSREDLFDAIRMGVREGIVDIGTDWGRKDIPHEIVYEAIKVGVRQAIWDMITNATQMPCGDFYDTVKDGVREAIENLAPPISGE